MRAREPAIAGVELDPGKARGLGSARSLGRPVGAGSKSRDAQHASAKAAWALVNIDGGNTLPEGFDGLRGGCWGPRRWRLQSKARTGELVVFAAIADEAVVPDAHETLGEDVQQEATDEFPWEQAHEAPAIAVRVVLVAEAHLLIGRAHQAVVGECNAVGVAAQILEYLLRCGKGPLGVDHPGVSA